MPEQELRIQSCELDYLDQLCEDFGLEPEDTIADLYENLESEAAEG
jgi:hypothetical protein